MKEFKFYSDGFELPVSVCETQKEAVYEITSAREALKLLDKEGECGCEKLIIDVIYKDGSTYYNSNNYAEEGKFKRTGIARAMVSTEYGTVVFGDFAITEYGDVSIDKSDIEEHGVYAGQYDVKEQEVQEAEQTEVEETAQRQKEVTKMKEYSVRYLSMKTLTSVCENGKTVKYTYEEAVEKAKELNARADVSYCKIYKGRTLIETVEKTVEETAENVAESAEVHLDEEIAEAFEKQKTFFKFYDVDIAYQVERYVNCGSLKYVQLGTYSDYAKAVQAAQEAIEAWGEKHIYFHTVEAAKRNSKVAKDKYDEKILKSEKKEIGYYWYASRLTDSKESVYISIDSPIRIPIKTTAERQKDKVIIMTNKEMQTAVENWYMNRKPSSSYFTMNGEKYAVLPRYGTSSNEFDVFKVKTFTIGESTHHYPYYDLETREPIDRIAVVTIPDELIAKKEAQIAEEENNNTLFEDFFKEV